MPLLHAHVARRAAGDMHILHIPHALASLRVLSDVQCPVQHRLIFPRNHVTPAALSLCLEADRPVCDGKAASLAGRPQSLIQLA